MAERYSRKEMEFGVRHSWISFIVPPLTSLVAGDLGSIPGLGRSSGEGNSNPLQHSYLENPMDGGYIPWGHKESDMTE